MSSFAEMNKILQQKLAQMLSRLIKIAEEFNVAVYMTNQGKYCSRVWNFFAVNFSLPSPNWLES